jgi:hypothetical protein
MRLSVRWEWNNKIKNPGFWEPGFLRLSGVKHFRGQWLQLGWGQLTQCEWARPLVSQ